MQIFESLWYMGSLVCLLTQNWLAVYPLPAGFGLATFLITFQSGIHVTRHLMNYVNKKTDDFSP